MKLDIDSFKLPAYNEIPDVGLYLEQVSKYLTEYLDPLGDVAITGSMISNYVKKKLIANPVRKQYYRNQIAELMLIAVMKLVMSIDDIRMVLEEQRNERSPEENYHRF